MLRLAADENFNGDIVRGLLRRNPTLDVVRIPDAGLSGADDPSVLQWAADQGRIIITHDISTLAKHAFDRIDDPERVLSFLQAQGALKALLPRLLAREWEGAYAEARVGYFFKCNGFKILKLGPEEVRDRPGDIDIQWMETEPIFVEVKGPGWKGELSQEERLTGRKDLPKYINGDARFLDTFGSLVGAIDKAIPKFSAARPNLVAIADDPFMSALQMPLDLLESRILLHLKEVRCVCVGGLLCLFASRGLHRA
jgi:hypothetical protein